MIFEIIHRMNTRSTSYTKKSVVAVLNTLNLQYTQKGIFFIVEVPTETRSELERLLQQIDRNVYYRVKL